MKTLELPHYTRNNTEQRDALLDILAMLPEEQLDVYKRTLGGLPLQEMVTIEQI